MSTFSNKSLSAEDILEKIRNTTFEYENYSGDMVRASFAENIDYVDDEDNEVEEWGWHEFIDAVDPWYAERNSVKPGLDLPGVGRITLEKQFGGEGQGDQYWFVIRVENGDDPVRLFKQDGWYASFDGGYYDGDFTEVKPVEKTVVFYE